MAVVEDEKSSIVLVVEGRCGEKARDCVVKNKRRKIADVVYEKQYPNQRAGLDDADADAGG